MEGGGDSKGIKWMSWSRFCDVKEGGGLSFRILREFNMAMLAKQAWRLMNNLNSLVTPIMKAKYYASSDFLNATMGNNSSYTWRSILAVQDSMRQDGGRKIIDGRDTRVW